MNKTEIIRNLRELKADYREMTDTAGEKTEMGRACSRRAEALDEAEKLLNTPSDRCVANEVLILAGVILGMVGIVAALSGTVLCWMGQIEKAGELVPYITAPMVLSLLSFAGVRK